MLTRVVGGSQDVSFVMSMLASYLFPGGERTIDEHIIAGHSLGANVTWRILRDGERDSAFKTAKNAHDLAEPRINVAIPLQGLPLECHLPYLCARAEGMGLVCEPPLCPPTLLPLLEAPVPESVYKGKRILSVHGGADEVVPFRFGEKTIGDIQKAAPEGEVKVIVLDGVVHEVTQEMVHLTADWIWTWAVA